MKSKIVSALVSLLVAFGLWLYVITVVSPDSTDTIGDIPVTMVGESALETRNLIITSTSNTNVDLTLTGNRSDLIEVNSSNITLRVDLSRIYDPGVHQLEYDIIYPGSVASNAFTEENKYPAYVTVTVEKKVSKEIPVEIVWNGSVPTDFMTDKENVELSHEFIVIKGPSSVVERIDHAEIAVDLNDQRESLDQSYRVTLCNEAHEPVDAELITVNTQEVGVKLTIQKVKEIPLLVTIVDGGGATEETVSYKIEPQTLKVSGTEAALADLKEINLGTIKLADYAEEQILTFDIVLPDGVTNQTRVNEVTVDVKFHQLTIKTFNITSISAINVPSGMEAAIITQALTVTVRGPAAMVNTMRETDISVVVDFSQATMGTVTRDAIIIITNPNFSSVGAVEDENKPYEVLAELKRIEKAETE